MIAALEDRPKALAAVWLLIVNGLRRGEFLTLRWESVDEETKEVSITQADYHGHLDTPKTEASVRTVPLDPVAIALLARWKRLSRRTAPSDLIFGTRNGKPDSPNNLLRRDVFRRTFSTWSSYNAVRAPACGRAPG